MSLIDSIVQTSLIGVSLAIAFYQMEREDERNRRVELNPNLIPQPGDNCPICLSEYAPPLEVLPCKHLFHRDCIATWFIHRWTCPVCTVKIDDSFRPEYRSRFGL